MVNIDANMKTLVNFKENISLIAIFLYGLGYITLSNYYSRFAIDIVYYVSLTDILFYTITSFIKLAIIVFAYALLSDIIVTYITKLLRIKPKNKLGIRNLNHIITFLIVIIIGFVLGEELYAGFFAITGLILNLELVEKNEQTIDETVERGGSEKYKADGLYFLLILLVPLSFCIGIKNGKDLEHNIYYVETPKIVEFKYNNRFISTRNTENCRFIGETSSYIFIYDVKTKSSLILDKSELQNFICIKNENYINLKYRYLNFDRFLITWYDENKNFFDD